MITNLPARAFFPDHPPAAHVTIVDAPCGDGKTTRMIKGLRPDRRYLIVTPLLSECKRIIEDAARTDSGFPGIHIQQPLSDGESDTKLKAIEELIQEGASVVCTHALYPGLVDAIERGSLNDYDILIDEAINIARIYEGVDLGDWRQVFIGDRYVEVDPVDGRCTPTEKWDGCVNKQSRSLEYSAYTYAKAGCLYYVDKTVLLWAIPPCLLLAGRSVTFLTYLSSGSMLLAYLDKRGIKYRVEHDKARDLAARQGARFPRRDGRA